MSSNGIFILKRLSGQMVIPAGLLILSGLLVWKWPELIGIIGSPEKKRAFINILPVLPYFILIISAVMGWRYNNSGLIIASLVLVLTYAGLIHLEHGNASFTEAVMVLLPLNITCFSLLTKKHILSMTGFVCIAIILVQAAAVLLFFSPAAPSFLSKPIVSLVGKEHFSSVSTAIDQIVTHRSFVRYTSLTTLSMAVFSLSLMFLITCMVLRRDIIIAGYAGAITAAMIGLASSPATPNTPVFILTSGLILILTNIEASFFRAYVDELTGLPGRRSLNETMANLGRKYTIAMMDIDHFKKFNDTYGHKTGDEVLKMVASKLNGITGGAKTFRYGGEEFTAVFKGKSIEDAMPHLEQFRYTIENTPFMVRSKSRKKSSQNDRGRGGEKKQVRVTMSIGAATPNKQKPTPESVIKSADKALYKAKKAGRNCVRS